MLTPAIDMPSNGPPTRFPYISDELLISGSILIGISKNLQQLNVVWATNGSAVRIKQVKTIFTTIIFTSYIIFYKLH